MSSIIFETNLRSLNDRDSSLASYVAGAVPDGTYSIIKRSKTGHNVPITDDGLCYNSLYDPIREAKLLIDSVKPDCFLFFAGIGGAFHIRDFLERYPDSECVIAESGFHAFRSLLEILDISDIISNPRVTVIPDCTDETAGIILPGIYMPALHGAFRLVSLRSWQLRNENINEQLERAIQKTLVDISADFSVQSHFGKLWFRNCIHNLHSAGIRQGKLPVFDLNKRAVIIAAGPSLEDKLEELRIHRDSYVLICTDTAFSTLADSGIDADVLVSIDCQAISVSHVMRQLSPGLTIFLDICGNTGIARKALESLCNLVFTSGGHPLARVASGFSVLPSLDTSSGTVTLAALDAAQKLGFTEIEILGADFAYRNGKPYARGTYLASSFDKSATRFLSSELQYCALMFRTPVSRIESPSGITYSTEVLQRYSKAYQKFRGSRCGKQWNEDLFQSFPAQVFLQSYRRGLENLLKNLDRKDPLIYTILPLLAWNSRNSSGEQSQKRLKNTIQLALDLIAGYNQDNHEE